MNFDKSMAYFGEKVHRRHMHLLLLVLGINGRLPMKYFGVILDGKRLPLSAYEPTLQKVSRWIFTRWKAKALSFAGKLRWLNWCFNLFLCWQADKS